MKIVLLEIYCWPTIPMKLLIVHNTYQSRNIGGEDIVYANELKLLTRELGAENIFSYNATNDNINKLRLAFSIWFSYKHYNNVKKIIAQNNIDLVHIHNFYPLLTISVFKAAKKSGAKVVHTLHNYRFWCIAGTFYQDGYGICELCTKHKFSLQGILNKCYRKSLPQSVLAQLSFWFYEFYNVFDYIDYFFVLTNFQKEKIKSLGVCEKKIILKPNSLQMPLNIEDKKHGYIYVGRLEESKGIYELLEVWKQLSDAFVLTIIGSGDIQKLQKKYQSANIIFKGKCKRADTIKSIAKSKYLIQPSIWYETFGLTIIEAMASGVPVIGFDIGTRSELIKDGINGFLSAKNNLKNTIEKSFNFNEYSTLSKNALAKAMEFNNEYLVKKQIAAYKNILKT